MLHVRFSTSITICAKQRKCMDFFWQKIAISDSALNWFIHSHSASYWIHSISLVYQVSSNIQSIDVIACNVNRICDDSARTKKIVTNRLFTPNTSFYSYIAIQFPWDTTTNNGTRLRPRHIFSTLSGAFVLYII